MTRQIWIRDTDGDLIAPLDAEAARRGVDRSTLCRVLLREALASLAATQARMGVVLDRAHEASGVTVDMVPRCRNQRCIGATLEEVERCAGAAGHRGVCFGGVPP